ncbi:MAG: Holliday junction resolvase RuvX [candidate division Zixibacteria bacterium]|nr:Holliday junction resolvase RuvX [candidate division Zixibacteria bacterium]
MQEKRIIGIDYGRRRIGLSCSDRLRLTAQPLATIRVKSTGEIVGKICTVLADYEVELLVIGRPGSLSGGGGQMADEVSRFAEQMKKRGYRVELVDERFSSREAQSVLRLAGKSEKQMRGKTDSIAAQLILQTWLDRQGNQVE